MSITAVHTITAEGLKLIEKERGMKKALAGPLRKKRDLPPEPLTLVEAKNVLVRLQIENEAREVSAKSE